MILQLPGCTRQKGLAIGFGVAPKPGLLINHQDGLMEWCNMLNAEG